jgi:hypothetical protein
LKSIGNALGKYIDKTNPKDQYACARICVEVDLEAGLPEVIKLTVGTWSYFQKLDYEKIPFKFGVVMNMGISICISLKTKKIQQEKEKNQGWKPAKKAKKNPKEAPDQGMKERKI